MDDMPRRRGRPSPLDDDGLREFIIDLIEHGCSFKDAADAAGIGEKSLYRRLEKDQEFDSRVRRASLKSKTILIKSWHTAAANDWKAAQAFLRAKYWQEWAERDPDTYTPEEFTAFCLRVSELVRKYVPADLQVPFASEVQAILHEMKK